VIETCRRGPGPARARMRMKKPGRADWIDLAVVEAQPPRGSTEESVSARGRRRTRGTYTLEELTAGGTRITFEFAWLGAPVIERLGAPLARAVVWRGTERSCIGSRNNSGKRSREAIPQMTDLPLTGGCNCGAVRFEVTEPLVAASYCHCKRC
jgi:hypothetical protein